MDQLDLLESVLNKTAGIIEGVEAHHSMRPTACDEYSVEILVNHMVGWLQVFAAGSQGRRYEGDASAYRHGGDPAAEFRTAAAALVAGWRDHGFDRTVRISGGETPAGMAFNMALMEYMTHGIDLAVATGQPIPYTDEEAAEVLARAEKTLPPEYRGDDMPFGHVVPIPDDAPAVHRLYAFLGRTPA